MPSLKKPNLSDKHIVSTSMDKKNLEQQTAKLLSSGDVSQPSIKPWQLSNLKQEEINQEEKYRSNFIEQLKKEVEPQVQEQTSLIKKNAYEDAYKKGNEEGFKQGLQAGKLEGQKQAEKEAEETLLVQVKSLQELVNFMSIPYQKISEEVFLNLVAIVTEISARIVKKEIAEDPKWILQVLQDALTKLPSETSQTEIYLTPIDLEIIKKYSSSSSPIKKNWQLIADQSIVTGSCKIKQNSSTLVDDWQEKLQEIMEQTKVISKSIMLDSDKVSSTSPNKNNDSKLTAE